MAANLARSEQLALGPFAELAQLLPVQTERWAHLREQHRRVCWSLMRWTIVSAPHREAAGVVLPHEEETVVKC